MPKGNNTQLLRDILAEIHAGKSAADDVTVRLSNLEDKVNDKCEEYTDRLSAIEPLVEGQSDFNKASIIDRKELRDLLTDVRLQIAGYSFFAAVAGAVITFVILKAAGGP